MHLDDAITARLHDRVISYLSNHRQLLADAGLTAEVRAMPSPSPVLGGVASTTTHVRVDLVAFADPPGATQPISQHRISSSVYRLHWQDDLRKWLDGELAAAAAAATRNREAVGEPPEVAAVAGLPA